MTLTQIWFSFQGRIGRLAYFGYGLLMAFVFGLIGVGSAAIILSAMSNKTTAGIVVGALLAVIAGLAFCWAGLALQIKRLHDIGHTGLMAIPIFAVSIAPQMIYVFSPTTAIVLWLVSTCVTLYLLFAPGTEGGNRFGPGPGMRAGRNDVQRVEPRFAA